MPLSEAPTEFLDGYFLGVSQSPHFLWQGGAITRKRFSGDLTRSLVASYTSTSTQKSARDQRNPSSKDTSAKIQSSASTREISN
jgi:hypothetical protein